MRSRGEGRVDFAWRLGIQAQEVTQPGDLPVEMPTKYELVINVVAAKALDLERIGVLMGYAESDSDARAWYTAFRELSDVCSLRNRYQQSESRGIQKSPFSLRDCLCSGILPFGPSARLGPSCGTFKGGYIMLKMLTAAAASFAMLSAAAAADLPRRQPPPPAPAPVGKAPIGKYPVGKYPTTPPPVVTKG
jgi:hypothetical protein